VHGLALVGYDEDAARATFSVHCSKGTYVRSLVRDLGELAGCGAYCEALRRTASGPLTLDGAATLADLDDAPTAGPWALVPAAAVAHLPARELDPHEEREIGFGRSLELRGEDGPTRCLAGERLVCIAEPDRGALRPRVVLEPAA
jgi:tRNA pseudouridine55 synthase